MKKILFICFLLVSSNLFANTTKEGNISIHVENDLISNTDFDYTNGVLFQYISKDIESLELPKWTNYIKDNIYLFNHDGYKNNIGLGFGQEMYTPRDIEDKELRKDDRPYAGWTYLTLSLHHKNEYNLHKLELKVGIVGPNSFAEDAQKVVHTLTGSSQPMGWHHQLKDELGLNLSYEYRKKYNVNNYVDVIPSLKLSVGNVSTYALSSLTMRCGYNLPNDFHSNRISSSGYALPVGVQKEPSFSCYMFSTISGYAVAVDIFLDGNTFEDSHRVNKEVLKGELELGVGLSYKNVYLTYTKVFKTKEYETQASNHSYGSINLGFRF